MSNIENDGPSRYLLLEGPPHELEELRREVLVALDSHVVVSDVRETRKGGDVFDSGSFGDSALAEFVIQYAADMSAAGTIAILAAVRKLVSKRRNVRLAERDNPDDAHQ